MCKMTGRVRSSHYARLLRDNSVQIPENMEIVLSKAVLHDEETVPNEPVHTATARLAVQTSAAVGMQVRPEFCVLCKAAAQYIGSYTAITVITMIGRSKAGQC